MRLDGDGRFIDTFSIRSRFSITSILPFRNWWSNGRTRSTAVHVMESTEVHVMEKTEQHHDPPWHWLIAIAIIIVAICTAYRDCSFCY